MKSPLEIFKNRNKKRNSSLYDSSMIEGIDYIICPKSDERLSMIKSNYIKNILGMTVEEYDRLYPGIRGVSPKRKNNIKLGLQQIDPETGLNKYELSQLKARETLKKIDSITGFSGYKKKGQKTRDTHLNKIDELGRNGYSQIATKAIIKGNQTKVEKGLILPPELKNEFHRYKSVVLYLTQKNKDKISKGYKTGLAGTEDAYHIDHIYSIKHGYQNKISPLIIGRIENLRMIPWRENVAKHSSSDISIEELYQKTNYTFERSSEEFDQIMYLIRIDIENNIPTTGGYLLERFYETDLC